MLFYVIPEKPYTFDTERALTEFNHLVDDDVVGTEISRMTYYPENQRYVRDFPK